MQLLSEHGMITSLMRPFFNKSEGESFSLPNAVRDGSRILCIDPGDLSEVLFYIPLIAAIRRRYPGSKIDFLLPEKHAALVVPSGLARQCILYKEKQLSPWRPSFASLLRQLGAGDYDMAVVMSFQPRPRLELAALASGASLRLGPSHENSWPAVNFEMRPPSGDDGYLGDKVAGLGSFFGFVFGELRSGWPLPMDKVRQMAQQVHFHKPNPEQLLLGVDPCLGKSGHMVAKKNLLTIVNHLVRQLQCRVIPLGHPDQMERITQFEQSLADVPHGLGRETLLEMALLVSQCDLFLAGNTDFFHLAVNLGIPTIGLFSPKDENRWVPTQRDNVKVLTIKKGAPLDFDRLMEMVQDVTKGRAKRSTPLEVSTGAEGEVTAEVEVKVEAVTKVDPRAEAEGSEITEHNHSAADKNPAKPGVDPPDHD
ncbi:MAG: glycosyltransferase family 9 protein [Gemmatimonadales bacterium]|nr:glycosyltransferase family 9 protein [Gemmatimonadales bacterium]